MPQNLNDLAERLEKLSDSIYYGASDEAKSLAVRLVTYLVNATPVDTSRAASNWIVSVGSRLSTYLPPHIAGKKGSSASASREQAVAIAQAVLSAKQPGMTIFIQNNAPYIKRLNEGYSKQAPAGFVEACLLIASKTIGKILK